MFNLVLCCQWKNFKVAIAIIDASADFFAATKRIILVSVAYFLLSLVVLGIFGVGAAFIVSLNDITPSQNGMQAKNFDWKSQVFWQLVGLVFVLCWALTFISDKTGFICMYSASHFYFTSSSNYEGSGSVVEGISVAYTKHAGSLALGSLINTAVQVLSFMVECLATEAQRENPENPAV